MENYSRMQKIARDEIRKALQAESETLTAQIRALTEQLNAIENAFNNKTKETKKDE